ncbi:MAG: cupin domain-containing protein [Kiritimatiellia bacterium]
MGSEDYKGRPLELVQEVAYASGSVVSKTLMNKDVGSLTLFAFDAGQGLSEHTSPYDAAVQILDGEVVINIGGNPLTARAGQLVIMPANVPHSLWAEKQFKMLLIMIRQPAT